MKSIKTSKFEDILKKYPELVKKLHENNFITTTPIQHKALDYALKNQDTLIQAPTGSGKTLIFAIKSIIESINSKTLSHLILAPNTLIAKQIYEMILKVLPEEYNINITYLNKNTSIKDNTNILISTPKILAKQLENNQENSKDHFNELSTLIIDEADIVLTKEFLVDLETVLEYIPEDRQDLLFSATYTREIGDLAKEYLHNPKVIQLPSVVEKKQIDQLIYIIENNSKLKLLQHTLKNLQFGLLLIFVNRIEHVKQVEAVVKSLKFDVKTISSKTSEFEREKILTAFKNEEFDILIGTDIISRGIDIPQITHIINYSIPQDHTKYIHRIGRATRHQNKGVTINFISNEDSSKFKQVLQEHKITFSVKQTPDPLNDLDPKVEKKVQSLIKHKKK